MAWVASGQAASRTCWGEFVDGGLVDVSGVVRLGFWWRVGVGGLGETGAEQMVMRR